MFSYISCVYVYNINVVVIYYDIIVAHVTEEVPKVVALYTSCYQVISEHNVFVTRKMLKVVQIQSQLNMLNYSWRNCKVIFTIYLIRINNTNIQFYFYWKF